MNKVSHSYWIQDVAPDGGYFDSIGLMRGTDLAKATLEFKNWAKQYPKKKSRLVLRTDVVVFEPEQS